MSQSAYQPGYTITPKYGQRYMNSSFAPAVGAPQSAAVSQPSAAPPQPAGQGYAMANPFAGNAQFTQAQQAYSTNIGAQPTTGFRRAIPGVQGAGPATPPVGTVPGMPAPPSTGASGTVQAASSGGDDPVSSPDYRPAAQALGYTASQSNPLAGVLAMVPGGSFINSALNMNPDYGKPGTYDAQGNVFGYEGRAYNPVTGSAAASYASPSAAYNTVTNSYGQLRNMGVNPIGSALGSYENSTYNISRADRMRGITPAGQAGLSTTYGLMRSNADLAPGETPGSVTFSQLGLDPNARSYGVPETGLTGQIGTGTGDVFISGGSYNPYVVSGTGSMTGQSGTLVATTDPRTGEKVSLLGDDGSTAGSASRVQEMMDYNADMGGDDDYNPSGGTTFSSTPTQTAAERADEEAAESEGGSWQDPIPSCFPEGTQISMADGTTKNIEDIVTGDKVISFNADNKLEEDEVTELHTHAVGTGRPTDKLVKVLLSNDKEIIVTSNHPFYMPEHNAFKWIGEFKKGELVMAENSLMYPVISVEEISDVNQVVYNFEVKNNHTYIAEGIRVHNGGGKSDDSGGSK